MTPEDLEALAERMGAPNRGVSEWRHEAIGAVRGAAAHLRRLAAIDRQADELRAEAFRNQFWSKVAPADPVTGCMVWTGSRVRDYGQISVGGTRQLAHRVAWEMEHGPLPSDIRVCHSCDNPPCVNHEHLWLGSDASNHADMVAKGRNHIPRGLLNAKARLTEDQVKEIHRRLAAGDPHRAIARDFAVSYQYVSAINLGKRWAHLHPSEALEPPVEGVPAQEGRG